MKLESMSGLELHMGTLSILRLSEDSASVFVPRKLLKKSNINISKKVTVRFNYEMGTISLTNDEKGEIPMDYKTGSDDLVIRFSTDKRLLSISLNKDSVNETWVCNVFLCGHKMIMADLPTTDVIQIDDSGMESMSDEKPVRSSTKGRVAGARIGRYEKNKVTHTKASHPRSVRERDGRNHKSKSYDFVRFSIGADVISEARWQEGDHIEVELHPSSGETAIRLFRSEKGKGAKLCLPGGSQDRKSLISMRLMPRLKQIPSFMIDRPNHLAEYFKVVAVQADGSIILIM